MSYQTTKPIDVCFFVEGAYPYVAGGVSSWVHEMILAYPDLNFGIVALLPDRAYPHQLRYDLPHNVVEFRNMYLQELKPGLPEIAQGKELYAFIAPLLSALQKGENPKAIEKLIEVFLPLKEHLGTDFLLNSHEAWDTLIDMYINWVPGSSFLDYFWSWRALVGGLYSILIDEYPMAKVYHTVATGYAGILGARARIETGRPLLLTEHGIYTNERRIELTMADWLHDHTGESLGISKTDRGLHQIWVNVFHAYAKACYMQSDEIITLYEGNRQVQIADGAPPTKTRLIPNGIDFNKFASIPRQKQDHPVIALIGRVVPIKDVKTYIRAVGNLVRQLPDIEALIMGPFEEDKDYYEECMLLVDSLGLGNTIQFTGRVKLTDYLGKIDLIVLTSISEAQPLVILEAGAAGVPIVATDVGACRELVYGREDESPKLGAGGAIVSLSNPLETGQAIYHLLSNESLLQSARQAIQERVKLYYNKVDIDRIYRDLYEHHRLRA
jgi:glycosyltransferase involved in cell wall biosynthesis